MNKFLACLISIMFSAPAFADTLVLTLQDVISQAREYSPAARVARTSYSNSYWTYRSFRSNYRPQLGLNAILPDLDRSITAITQDDGRDEFIRRSQARSFAELALSQQIAPTGSEIFVSSQLTRIDIFNPRSVSYLANPAVIGIRQPLLGFNPLRWDLMIEPLRFEEAQKRLNAEMETVSMQAVELFFRLLQAQNSVRINELNVTNNDTLYQITRGRYNLGKIAENDLLQMELNLMNARNQLSQAQLDQELATTRLLNFLKLPPGSLVRLIEPRDVPELYIDESFALEQARKNRSEVIEYERLLLEAEMNLQQAKSESRFQADVFATYGLTQSAPVFDDVYVDPQDQQRVRVGLEVPILSWGRNKARVQTAKANLELAEVNVEQARESFEQEVVLLVRQLQRYRDKLEIASRADTIAQRRFEITMNRYLIGKIGILDLNLALQEKDQARASFLSSLESYWNIYFEIRRKTLYDFMLGRPISYLRN